MQLVDNYQKTKQKLHMVGPGDSPTVGDPVQRRWFRGEAKVSSWKSRSIKASLQIDPEAGFYSTAVHHCFSLTTPSVADISFSLLHDALAPSPKFPLYGFSFVPSHLTAWDQLPFPQTSSLIHTHTVTYRFTSLHSHLQKKIHTASYTSYGHTPGSYWNLSWAKFYSKQIFGM